jgi:hypothetical protein
MKRSATRFLCVVACISVMVAIAPGSATAKDERLRGNRIILPADEELTIPASEPSFVKHGFGFCMEDCESGTGSGRGWTNLSADERQERMDEAVWRFELFADGVPVVLEHTFHNEGSDAEPRQMLTWFFVQFEAGHFSPGQTVVFEGHWYGDEDEDDVSELEVVFSRTVIFT